MDQNDPWVHFVIYCSILHFYKNVNVLKTLKIVYIWGFSQDFSCHQSIIKSWHRTCLLLRSLLHSTDIKCHSFQTAVQAIQCTHCTGLSLTVCCTCCTVCTACTFCRGSLVHPLYRTESDSVQDTWHHGLMTQRAQSYRSFDTMYIVQTFVQAVPLFP